MNSNPTWKINPTPGVASLYINSVAISGDGKTVFGGNYFFDYSKTANHSSAPAPTATVGVYLWNSLGKIQWQDTFQATEGVYWVALSRDGAWAASGGLASPVAGFISAYDVSTGRKSLTFPTKTRVSRVALSGDGTCLVAGAESIFVFKRSGPSWSIPQVIPCGANDRVVSVDVSDDGKWMVAGSYNGLVTLVRVDGTQHPVTWQQPAGSIRWVAMAADGSGFVVAAKANSVIYFNTAAFLNSSVPAWIMPLVGSTFCSSVALSGDGTLVSAVGNVGGGGKVILISNLAGAARLLWSAATLHNANSTSLDSAGCFVTVADGHPDQTPGAFYLYDAAGNLQWRYDTSNMSWPMLLSGDGTAIAAGSDDSNVYYFS